MLPVQISGARIRSKTMLMCFFLQGRKRKEEKKSSCFDFNVDHEFPPPMDVPRKNSALLFLKCIFLIIAKSLVNEKGVMVHLFYITLIKD